MKRWITALCMLAVLTMRAGAYDAADMQAQLEATGAPELARAVPEEANALLQGIDVSDAADLGAAMDQMLQNLEKSGQAVLSDAVRSLTKIMLIAVLVGCLSGLRGATGGGDVPIIAMAGALGVTGVLFSDWSGMLSLCSRTLEQVSEFSGVLLPVMAGAVSLTGAPATATALQGITMISFDLLVRFITGLLAPAVCAYIAIITVNAALGNDILGNLAAFVKWLTTSSLKLALTVFITYLTISGAVGGGVDALAVKTAKFAVSGSVPVVGGIISDAAESMLAGAAVIKNTVGVFGMLCVAATCLIPFLKVGINYLLFKAGAAVMSPICGASLSKLLSGISDSFGLMLGMLGTCCAILFFELTLSVALVKPV